MAWFKKEGEVENKPGEQSKTEVDTLVEKLNASFAEQLKPISEKMATFEERFGKIETNTTRQAPENKNTETPSVFDSEDAAFEARLAPLRAELTVKTALLNANQVESMKLSELSESGWGELVPEVKDILGKTPVEMKGRQDYHGFVQNVIDMAIGRAAKKGGVRYDQGRKTFFVEDASLSSSNENTGKSNKLNEESSDGRVDITGGMTWAEWAKKKMGIDPEKLAESIN